MTTNPAIVDKTSWTLEFSPHQEQRYLAAFQRDIRRVSAGFAVACLTLVSFTLANRLIDGNQVAAPPANVVALWATIVVACIILFAASASDRVRSDLRWIQLACLTPAFGLMIAGAWFLPSPFDQTMFDNARIFISVAAFLSVPLHWRLFNLTACTLLLFVTEHSMSGELPFSFVITTTATVGVGFWGSVILEKILRRNYALSNALAEERERSHNLLRSIFPGPIFDRIKNLEKPAFFDRFDDVTVIFADIVGFTPFAAERTPEEVVTLLDQIISRLDASCAHAGALKVKTIGDGYLAAVGIPDRDPEHCYRAADLALEFREAVKKISEMTGIPLSMRIGLHCGSVVAGIMGRTTPHFDLWGDTVNIAARIESTGVPGEIQISEMLANRLAGRYELSDRGEVQLKGRGGMKIFTLLGPIPPP